MSIEVSISSARLPDLLSGLSVVGESGDGRAFRIYRMGAKILDDETFVAVAVPPDVVDELVAAGQSEWVPFDEDETYLIKLTD